MSDLKAFASLSPTLLARKGGARPAMRQFQDTAALQMQDECGWNDMGESPEEMQHEAEIVSINGGKPAGQSLPEVLHRQARLAQDIDRAEMTRRSALADGRRAAFTLRIDANRHLKLRLASTITNRSAQQLVTEALDKLLDAMPELNSLAARVRGDR